MSLNIVFLKYLLTLGATFLGILLLVVIIFVGGMDVGAFIPANHVEELIRQVKPILQTAPEVTEKMIPDGAKFTVFDKDFNVVKTDMNKQDLEEAMTYAKGGERYASTKSYYFIERQDGSCVLGYYVQIRYGFEWLNEHFPNPQFFMLLILVIGCLITTLIVSMVFAKKVRNHLIPLMEATEKIKNQELNFEIGNSGIKEFNDVLTSISDMKWELKNSLEEQWNLEQMKKEQISALAHDIKTPLTVIKGNAELLEDSYLNEEQQYYNQFIIKNSMQIEKYVKMLIEASKAEGELSPQFEHIHTSQFVTEIANQLHALAISKHLKVEVEREKKYLPEEVIIDTNLLHRALMNVISNAVNYCPVESRINLCISNDGENLRFTVTDSGKGFSQEGLKFATKQFYMDDSSRTSKTHFGMGLYITNRIVELHKGKMYLENSSETGGGKVTVEIPI